MEQSEIKFIGVAFYDANGKLSEVIKPSDEVKEDIEAWLNEPKKDNSKLPN